MSAACTEPPAADTAAEEPNETLEVPSTQHASPAAEVEAHLNAAGSAPDAVDATTDEAQPQAQEQQDLGSTANADRAKSDAVKPETAESSRAEYMTFYRAGRNPKKLPAKLKDMFENIATRKELFKMWLENGKDLGKCEVEVRRRDEARTTGSHGRSAWSKRQMENDGRYTKELALKRASNTYMAVSLLFSD